MVKEYKATKINYATNLGGNDLAKTLTQCFQILVGGIGLRNQNHK